MRGQLGENIHKDKSEAIPPEVSVPTQDDVTQSTTVSDEVEKVNVIRDKKVELRGSLIMDATVCPQEIAYPTDLDLLNESREQSEKLIDGLMDYIREWTALKIKSRGRTGR
ncbi:MAG: hypothetical protein IPM42_06735 [Saprospiraceae bacterium]|nr:hypothetical protein [Saprospiraceae bacterium]